MGNPDVDAEQELHAELTRLRAEASAGIIGSTADKKLIVAGPGTGKTYTFREALAASGGKGLALTFIRNLVVDLTSALGDLADVFTLHGYCKHLMHRHDVAGLKDGDYYPPLLDIVVDDILALDGRVVDRRDVDVRLHALDESDGLIGEVLLRADYYNAVSHNDLVYRVLRHFEASPETIPTFPLIVVDEYQDFSLLEATFIDLLGTKSPELIAGDDDQALYKDLKHASPDFIRGLARGDVFETFELPYCSRCTSVIVDAVNDAITAATAQGNLADRLTKNFACYLPDKGPDSEANPKIIHVQCSTANTEYAGRYIAQQIARIPAADIESSRREGYPTALVIGPNPFLRRAFETVLARFPHARMKTSARVEVDVLDGYRRIATNDRSRLGWRIVLATRPFSNDRGALTEALASDTDLVDHLPARYVEEHGELARLVGVLLDGGGLADDDEASLTTAVGRTLEGVRNSLAIEEAEDVEVEVENEVDAPVESEPDVLFTSLVGSKGLSAEHVFVVGLNDGHFPRRRDAVSDDEVCNLLVALSRTRKRCHVISYKFFGKGFLTESLFLDWIRAHLEPTIVDKNYDFSE